MTLVIGVAALASLAGCSASTDNVTGVSTGTTPVAAVPPRGGGPLVPQAQALIGQWLRVVTFADNAGVAHSNGTTLAFGAAGAFTQHVVTRDLTTGVAQAVDMFGVWTADTATVAITLTGSSAPSSGVAVAAGGVVVTGGAVFTSGGVLTCSTVFGCVTAVSCSTAFGCVTLFPCTTVFVSGVGFVCSTTQAPGVPVIPTGPPVSGLPPMDPNPPFGPPPSAGGVPTTIGGVGVLPPGATPPAGTVPGGGTTARFAWSIQTTATGSTLFLDGVPYTRVGSASAGASTPYTP